MNNNLHPEFWAWLAGFIDGEGSIGLYKEKDIRKGEKYYHYRPALKISNTDCNSLELIRCMLDCGEPIVHIKLKSSRHQYCFQYKIRNSKELYWVLSNLMSRLKIKYTQAIRVMQYIEGRESSWKRGWYKPMTEKDTKIYEELKRLNSRGEIARLIKQGDKNG